MSESPEEARALLAKCRRVIVKIGSKAIARDAHATPSIFERMARDIRSVMDGGRSVVLVSSGAIALGVERLALGKRPKDTPGLQAAAAAGQGLLMQRYGDAFDLVGLKVAQVLLTHADLASRARANNARAALDKLLELGVVPIINENDAVAIDEIRFGDNDELAAMVAPLCDASALLLLSDVEGLLDERGGRVPFVPRIGADVLALATDVTSGLGRGGMQSKLEAARRATIGGTHAVIAPAHQPSVISRVVAGEDIGTIFPALTTRLSGRKQWIAFTLRPHGAAIVDDGAARAIREGGRSVLSVGVIGIRGDFVTGDPISILTTTGREIARGLTRLSAADAARLAGVRAEEEDALLVHRDDLVVLPDDQ